MTSGNDKLLFLHVPKTGGEWAVKAMEAAGVDLRPEGGHKHAALHEVSLDGRFIFAFVREPLAWYGSWYQMAHRTRPAHRMWAYVNTFSPARFLNLPFPQYIFGCSIWLPAWLSNLYKGYCGPPTSQISFVGRYENLVDDLVQALALAGQEFDEDAIRAMAPVNVSAPPPQCPEDIKERLRRSEWTAYERFYSNLTAESIWSGPSSPDSSEVHSRT